MGKRGPAPKPTKLKALQGNPGKRPLNENEPEPTGEVKKPYGYVKHQPKISKLWDKYAPVLKEMGLLTPADELAFIMMLRHAQICHDAWFHIRTEGIIRYDEQGIERKHPAMQIIRDNSSALLRYMAKFGFTPSDRQQFSADGEKVPTIADELFKLVEGND